MRLVEITAKLPPSVLAMSDAQRHEWLEFIHRWLSGRYMRSPSDDALAHWRQFAQLFPPKAPPDVTLFRLVTVPIAYAGKSQFRFKPAPNAVSSWTRTLVGLDAVAGIAQELTDTSESSRTARLGIEARIPGKLVLATPRSIRDAFMALSHDYFDRYQERESRTTMEDGTTRITIGHPGYPGGEKADFSMDDVGFLQDVLQRPGGHYRQYEYVVETPPLVDATVVQLYRVGDEEIRIGNEDPHQFPTGVRPPRITRLKPVPRKAPSR